MLHTSMQTQMTVTVTDVHHWWFQCALLHTNGCDQSVPHRLVEAQRISMTTVVNKYDIHRATWTAVHTSLKTHSKITTDMMCNLSIVCEGQKIPVWKFKELNMIALSVGDWNGTGHLSLFVSCYSDPTCSAHIAACACVV